MFGPYYGKTPEEVEGFRQTITRGIYDAYKKQIPQRQVFYEVDSNFGKFLAMSVSKGLGGLRDKDGVPFKTYSVKSLFSGESSIAQKCREKIMRDYTSLQLEQMKLEFENGTVQSKLYLEAIKVADKDFHDDFKKEQFEIKNAEIRENSDALIEKIDNAIARVGNRVVELTAGIRQLDLDNASSSEEVQKKVKAEEYKRKNLRSILEALGEIKIKSTKWMVYDSSPNLEELDFAGLVQDQELLNKLNDMLLKIGKATEKWDKLVVAGNKTIEGYVTTAKDFIGLYQCHYGVLQKTVMTTINVKKLFMKKFESRAKTHVFLENVSKHLAEVDATEERFMGLMGLLDQIMEKAGE
ncbi:hypothetical protein CRE_04263 [Caenorhabditis remanei]|uniref:Uncharacterized protein n=1 Tax=Caenorhabditis remanei TaxID=31234 RepID=E3NAP6_CAERE|nr:hypothetical protein CRE_04263 [Caenorhabditis remanei]